MNACSSDTRAAARWCTGIPAAQAVSPTCSSPRPRTSNSPGSPALVTPPPAAVTALASASGCGLRTRTAWPELRAMNSAMPQSAMSLPRPTTRRWSAVFSISDIRWLETRTVRPSAASALIRVRIAKQRGGDAEPLAHAERESLGSLPGYVAQPDDAEYLGHPARRDVVGLGQ